MGNASQNMSWWHQRQAGLTRAVAQLCAKINRNIKLVLRDINKTIRELKEKRPWRIFSF
jgi:hypothetical protein